MKPSSGGSQGLPGIPFKRLVGMFKDVKVNVYLQRAGSFHQEIPRNVIPSSTGRKWKLFDRQRCLGGFEVECGAIRRCDLRVMTSGMVGHVVQRSMGLEFAGGDKGKSRSKLGRRQQLVQAQREDRRNIYIRLFVWLSREGGLTGRTSTKV